VPKGGHLANLFRRLLLKRVFVSELVEVFVDDKRTVVAFELLDHNVVSAQGNSVHERVHDFIEVDDFTLELLFELLFESLGEAALDNGGTDAESDVHVFPPDFL